MSDSQQAPPPQPAEQATTTVGTTSGTEQSTQPAPAPVDTTTLEGVRAVVAAAAAAEAAAQPAAQPEQPAPMQVPDNNAAASAPETIASAPEAQANAVAATDATPAPVNATDNAPTTQADATAPAAAPAPAPAPAADAPAPADSDAGAPAPAPASAPVSTPPPTAPTPQETPATGDDSMLADESMMADESMADISTIDASPDKSGAQGTPKPKKERAKPKPRSKSATKITRFRKITSCLQCREKKQKCDRVKPVCGNCRENPTEDPCHFIDDEQKRPEPEEEVAQNGSFASPLSRKRKYPGEEPLVPGQQAYKRADFPHIRDRRHVQFLQARREMVEKLAEDSKDPSRDFSSRVTSARAAAIADVLFASDLTLPTADQVSKLMYTYKTQVEPFVNVVITDINMARFLSFLRWWHSKPTTMPADPPLVPLILTVLALAMQATRTSIKKHDASPPLSNQDPIPGINCSPERELLIVAGHAIDALQIACPSAWSSTFQAPIDLIKASLLRGVWHQNELNLQFAGSCFALTTRLAFAAGLHRDPKHWSGMRTEEAQARRNLWWNIVYYEIAHAHRLGQPPCLTHEGFDTSYPDFYDALHALYEYAGLADPDPARISLPAGANALVPRIPTRSNFDYHCARFRIYHIFSRHTQQLFRLGVEAPQNPNLIEDYTKWKNQLPAQFKEHFERREQGSVLPSAEVLAKMSSPQPNKGIYDPLAREEYETYIQGYNLEFMYHQSMITIHRPYIDEHGAWKPAESVQRSLEVCLTSSEAIIGAVSDVLSIDPPFSMFNLCAYFTFNAGLVLAIHCKLNPTTEQHRPSLQNALANLQELSRMSRLGNIAEQSGRYANTLKQMLQSIGGDLARLANEAVPSSESKNGDASGANQQEAGIGALDPSLNDDPAATKPVDSQAGDSQGEASADKVPEKLPAFLLPFMGLPLDLGSLGADANFWSLDGLNAGLPPIDPSHDLMANGGSWPPQFGDNTSDENASSALPEPSVVAAHFAEYLTDMNKPNDSATDGAQLAAHSQQYNHQDANVHEQPAAPKPYDESASRTTAENQEYAVDGSAGAGAGAGDKTDEGQEQHQLPENFFQFPDLGQNINPDWKA